MEKVNIDKYVIMIKDIIDQEEADFLIDMAKGATDEEWDAYRKSLGEEADSVNAAYGDWKKQMLWLELNTNLFERAKDLVESINKRCIYLINDHYQTDYILDQAKLITYYAAPSFSPEHIGYSDVEVQKVKRIYDWMNAPQDATQQMKNRYSFYQYFSNHDIRRGTDFCKTFPELEEFYNFCKTIKV